MPQNATIQDSIEMKWEASVTKIASRPWETRQTSLSGKTLGPGKAGEPCKKCIGIETRLEKAWNDGDYAAIMRKMKNRSRRCFSRWDWRT